MMELWPFTNFHDLNLDWLISKWKKLEENLDDIHASMDAAADSATAASTSMGMALFYQNKAKDYRDEAQGFANDAQDSADSIAGVVTQVNTNTSRIDNLVANAGDTDNNAELLDIRVGYNGMTYSTAGDAVRNQTEQVEFEIEGIFQKHKPITFDTVMNEEVNRNDGSFVQSGWARTVYIPVTAGEVIRYSLSVPTLYNAFYDSSQAFISAFTTQANTNGSITVPANAAYMVLSNSKAGLQKTRLWRVVPDDVELVKFDIVNPYYFPRYTGDIVEGQQQSLNGAFIKFDTLRVRTNKTDLYEASWTQCKTDMVPFGPTNAVITESYDLTPDTLRLLNNFALLFDLDTNTFVLAWNTSAFPAHALPVFWTDTNGNPSGPLYELAKLQQKRGIDCYLEDVKTKELDVLNFADKFSFTFCTDLHYYFNEDTGYYNSTNEVVSRIDNDISVDVCINGGDSIYHGSKNKKYALGSLSQIFKDINPDKMLYCIGNHDFNGVGATGTVNTNAWVFDDQEVETLIERHNTNVTRPEGKRYFYRDFTDKKIRIISLDTQDIDVTFSQNGNVVIDPLTTYGVRQAQLEWLCDEALDVPDDSWNILVVMHVGMYTSENGFPANNVLINRDALKNIFNKYVQKDVYSYADTDTTYNGYFTINGSGTFAHYHGNLVAVLSGHAHEDGYTNVSGFNAIQTMSSYPDVNEHPDREANTFSSIAIDCGCIDTVNRKITLKRFGDGSDREYTY